MKKRRRWADAAGAPKAPDKPYTAGSSPPSKLRIVFLVVSSALLSGIAVVLWNRHSLEKIREVGPEPLEQASFEFV